MEHNTKLIIAIEGFLRNASYIDAPFMVKGSIITRQFFPNPNIRFVQDLDWVYLEPLDEVSLAGRIFSDWVIKVTEANEDDRVWFRSFRDNNFWRTIDYAMNDDFPTTNTDLLCIIDDTEEIDPLELDISFNLDIDFPPEEMTYIPLSGKPFELKRICPYSLQISWKLHQLIVRPRLKDIFDLIFLLRHRRFCNEEFEKIMFAFKKECKRDNISPTKLVKYINGTKISAVTKKLKAEKKQSLLQKFLWGNSVKINKHENSKDLLFEDQYSNFTAKEYFPYKGYSDILKEFQKQLIDCGFTEKALLT